MPVPLSKLHITLVCTPITENVVAKRITGELEVLLKDKGIPYRLIYTEWPEKIENTDQIWIIGGDGTLNWFINLYPDIKIPLSVFPGGTGNDFHYMLYSNMSTYEQAEHILRAEPKPVDGGLCNNKLFITGVGVGFDGAIVKDLLGRQKLAGKASYMLSILKNIVTYREKLANIVADGERFKDPYFIMSVANGKRYGGGFYVAPKAEVNDGLLDLNLIGSISPLNRIRYLPILERGEHLDLPITKYRQVSEVTLEFDEPIHAHRDGEYLYSRKFNIKVLPKRFSFLY